MKKTNENGITLIALVVTIVVLLILAGITITYVLADGGIFKEAQNAAKATTAGSIQDYASQMQVAVMTDYYTKTAVGGTPTIVSYNTESPSEGQTKADKTWATGFFPEGGDYTVTDSTLVVTNDKIASGTVTVTSKKHPKVNFTVTFTSGSAEVTYADAE